MGKGVRDRVSAGIFLSLNLLGVGEAGAQLSDPIPARIPQGAISISLQLVASGLRAPNLLVNDGAGRSFVVDQTGAVGILQNGSMLSTPFLDVSSRLVSLNASYDERGLLGFALDPGFHDPQSAGYGRVFTYTSEPVSSGVPTMENPFTNTINHHSVVASWRVNPENPDQVDVSSRLEIMRIEQPQANHNGGMLAFGEDGMMYIGLGDGGASNDTAAGHNSTIGNGQDNAIALGKILRIDVNGTNSANGKYGIPAGNPFASSTGAEIREIYASGLRNPYRFSFDGATLIVPDVGQNEIEEVNIVQAGGNYGWRYKEGTFRFNTNGTVSSDLSGLPEGLIDPVAQYDHDDGISIIAGFIYNGLMIPELQGKYVFGDFSLSFSSPSGRLFYADLDSGEIAEFLMGESLGLFLKGFGEDADGELYVLGSTRSGPGGTEGVILKIVPEPHPITLAVGGLCGLALLQVFRRRSRARKR